MNMKMKVEDLPKCQLVFRGHTVDGIDNEIIEEGDVFQVIAPRSKFHKVVGIFDGRGENTVRIYFKNEHGEFQSESIWPEHNYLTWADFSFKKINSLDEIIK